MIKLKTTFITKQLKQNKEFIQKCRRIFTSSNNNKSDEELGDSGVEAEIKIPNFKTDQPADSNVESTQRSSYSKVERQREVLSQATNQNKAVKLTRQQLNEIRDQRAENSLYSFDQKLEQKYGQAFANNLINISNLKKDDGGRLFYNIQNYTSMKAPGNSYAQKRIINSLNEPKNKQFQRTKYTSFEEFALDQRSIHSDSHSHAPTYLERNQMQYYLNKERVTQPLSSTLNDIIPIENDWQDASTIPKLANGLDVILKNPGIYPVETINHFKKGKLGQFFTRLPQYSQINEDCIGAYFPPGQDSNLLRQAVKHNSKYIMSTSTVSSVLSHIYYCLSNFKSPHFNSLSEPFDREPLKFMISQRKPNTVFLTRIDKNKKIYSIDGDSGFIEPSNVVLLKMGKYMEKMLTTDHQFFTDHYVLDTQTHQPKKPVPKEALEVDYFRYMKCGNLLLRSQIDCMGHDANGNEVIFELKTRATAVLRYDIENYIDYLDYEIVKYKGRHSSYEREYYDLIRGGFLKYIMQCKIGRMQGAMIAYHNTQKIFGFEYVPLKDMERRVFGCSEFSDVVFKNGLNILEKIFDFILEDQETNEFGAYKMDPPISSSGKGNSSPTTPHQNKMYRVGFYANEGERLLNIMVESFEDDMFYQERFKNMLPEYMKDPIDYYISHKIQPQVYKYSIALNPVLNGKFVDYSPILFEAGDTLDVKFGIQKQGKVGFNEYMRFLHEAYKCYSINLDNEYTGTWRFQM